MKYNKGAILRSVEQPFLKDSLPQFDTGDTVRVNYRVSEGNRTRIQAFEGVVIARQNGKGARASFTVRKVSFGEGVERVFPLHSPLIDSLNVVRRGRTRRAKLYYLRELRGKKARLRTDLGRQEVDRANAKVEKAAAAERAKAAAVEAEEKAKADALAAEEAAKAEAEAQAKAEAEAEAAEVEAKAAEEAKAQTEAEAKAAEEAAKVEAQAVEEAATEEAPESAAPKAEAAEAEVTGAASTEADDLTRIEGIGPKYAEALIAAGISSYADVAKASEEEFQKAAAAADMKNANSMATWAKQAQLLVDGDEAGLKALQDELDGGVEKS